MTFPYFGGPEDDDDERPMSAGMGETRAVTTKSHQTQKCQEKKNQKKEKKQLCETHFLNSATRWTWKVEALNSHQLLIPSACVRCISPHRCAEAPGGELRFPFVDVFTSPQVVKLTSVFQICFTQARRGRNIKSSVALAAAPFRVFTSTRVPAAV